MYKNQQKLEAVRIYESEGPSEASRQTGIAKATIGTWAKEAGVRTFAPQKTAEATEMRRGQNALRREDVKHRLLEKALTALERMDEPVTAHVGQEGKEVTYDKPTASDFRHYAISAAILIDKLRLEGGETTARPEVLNTTDFDQQVADLVAKVREEAEA